MPRSSYAEYPFRLSTLATSHVIDSAVSRGVAVGCMTWLSAVRTTMSMTVAIRSGSRSISERVCELGLSADRIDVGVSV
jgi:hypothetical protein